MLEDGMGHPDQGVKMERCKPDYETDIKRNQEVLAKTQNFKNALLEYVGYAPLRGTLAELVGELFCKERQILHTIEMLIEAQEKESAEE